MDIRTPHNTNQNQIKSNQINCICIAPYHNKAIFTRWAGLDHTLVANCSHREQALRRWWRGKGSQKRFYAGWWKTWNSGAAHCWLYFCMLRPCLLPRQLWNVFSKVLTPVLSNVEMLLLTVLQRQQLQTLLIPVMWMCFIKGGAETDNDPRTSRRALVEDRPSVLSEKHQE